MREMGTEPTDRLLALLRLDPPRGEARRAGTGPPVSRLPGLPDDFTTLVMALTQDGRPATPVGGWIDLIVPPAAGTEGVDGPVTWGHQPLLDDLRALRENEDRVYPYPLHPEPGGLLPWGIGRHGEGYFWLTADPDPNRWPVVYSDPEYEVWATFRGGGMTAFLLAWIDGDVTLLVHAAADHGTVRLPSAPETPGPAAPPPGPPGSGATSWPSFLETLLRDVPAPRANVAATTAERAEEAGLPGDYVGFLRRFGPGTFCDVTILGPGDDPVFGIEAVAARIVTDPELADTMRRSGPVLPWGVLPDGFYLGWRVQGDAPVEWPLAVLRRTGCATWNGVGFAEFLCRYSGHGRTYPLRRLVWWQGAIFTPAP